MTSLLLDAHAFLWLAQHHRDPFDRLLIAQTVTEGLSLVSADTIFDHYGISRLW